MSLCIEPGSCQAGPLWTTPILVLQ